MVADSAKYMERSAGLWPMDAYVHSFLRVRVSSGSAKPPLIACCGRLTLDQYHSRPMYVHTPKSSYRHFDSVIRQRLPRACFMRMLRCCWNTYPSKVSGEGR